MYGRHYPDRGFKALELGRNVCRELVRKQHRVVALDDLSGGFVENVDPGARFVKGSITDAALIPRLKKVFNSEGLPPELVWMA